MTLEEMLSGLSVPSQPFPVSALYSSDRAPLKCFRMPWAMGASQAIPSCVSLRALLVAAVAEEKRRRAEELLLLGEAQSEKQRLEAAAKRAAKKERQLRQKAEAQRAADEKAAAEAAAAGQAAAPREQVSQHENAEVCAGLRPIVHTLSRLGGAHIALLPAGAAK